VGVGKDRALKRLAGIPDKDSVIMMISVGQLPEQLVVTHSPLKPIEEVLFVK
jgi:hypothetical protein